MPLFNATLVGLPQLIGRIQGMGDGVRKALEVRVQILALKLQAHIVRDKLSGQVLGVRTGDLRRSITQRMESLSNGVYGYVFSSGDVKYAAFWEFGFSGIETVKAHMRSMVFGREVQPFTVPSYTRKVDSPARPFMQPGFADMSEEIRQGMIDAVKEGLRMQVMGR